MFIFVLIIEEVCLSLNVKAIDPEKFIIKNTEY